MKTKNKAIGVLMLSSALIFDAYPAINLKASPTGGENFSVEVEKVVDEEGTEIDWYYSLQCVEEGTSTFELDRLVRNVKEDETIFSFAYISDMDITSGQLVFRDLKNALYILKLPELPAQSEWTTISIDISNVNPKWGQYLDVIQLKLNMQSDCKLGLKNLWLHSEGEEWREVDNRAEIFEMVQSLGLPVMEIETNDGEIPTFDVVTAPEGCMGVGITNATKVPGSVKIYSPENELIFDSGEYESKKSGMTIKVRGNTSAAQSIKKPYKIKLQKKDDLLCRGDKKYNDKNWVLLYDSWLTTYFGFHLNELLGFEWSPAHQFVNVIFNGEYHGLYILAESVERNDKCRIDVDEETGFISELDAYWWNEDGNYFDSKLTPKYNFTLKYPDYEDIADNEQLLSSIQETLTDFEENYYTERYDEVIDVESFARWCLGHDILSMQDTGGTNKYFKKYDNASTSKLEMPAIWDFDTSEWHLEGWSPIHQTFFSHLFEYYNNPAFIAAYIKLWDKLSPTIFDEMAEYTGGFASSELGKCYDQSALLDRKLYYNATSNNATYCGNRSNKWYTGRKTELTKLVEGVKEELTSQIMEASTLPVVNIVTTEGKEPESDYMSAPEGMTEPVAINCEKIEGSVTVTEVGGKVSFESGEYGEKSGMTIKCWGNNTADKEKKTYKIELQKKGDMLAREETACNDRNWILMPDDEMKNRFGLFVSKTIGMDWTPECKDVNLFINGEFKGMYLLMESVERNEDCRVNIDRSGFVAELNPYWWNEDGWFESQFAPSHNYTLQYPAYDELSEREAGDIASVINEFDNYLFEGGHGPNFPELIDKESFGKWLLVQDVESGSDYIISRKFIYKNDNTESSRIMAGPVFDFADAEGEMDDWSPVHVNLFSNLLFYNEYVEDPYIGLPYLRKPTEFARDYLSLWEGTKDRLFDSIDRYLADYAVSEEPNMKAQAIILNNAFMTAKAPTVENNVERVSTWYSARKSALERKFEELNEMLPSAIETLEGDDIEMNAVSIQNGSIVIRCSEKTPISITDTTGKIIYQGNGNADVEAGAGIYIVKVGAKAYKVVC